jgi:cutinase
MVAVEGVPYSAAVQGNTTPQGADAKGIRAASKLFNDVASKCPKAAILGGGYSQGAALMHRSIEALPRPVQNRIAGVVLFGDTKNKQDGGRIKNFPQDKTKIYCNKNDGVCGGALQVNAGHLAYKDSVVSGGEWAAGKVKAFLAKQGN